MLNIAKRYSPRPENALKINSLHMEQQHPRRSYIRRKRCLSECTKIIQGTLKDLVVAHRMQLSEQAIGKMALTYAQNVEAHCWSPRLQISDECYRQKTIAKARELCKALMRKPLPIPVAPVPVPVPPVPAMDTTEPRTQFVQEASETTRDFSFPESGEDDIDEYWPPPKFSGERSSSPLHFK